MQIRRGFELSVVALALIGGACGDDLAGAPQNDKKGKIGTGQELPQAQGQPDAEEQSQQQSETKPGGSQCIFLPDHWRNLPVEQWPEPLVVFVGETSYGHIQAQRILDQPVSGNGLISLAHQLIAAQINIANGGDRTGITDHIFAVHQLIHDLAVPPFGRDFLPPSDTAELEAALYDYNSGRTGAGCYEPRCGNGRVDEGEQCDDGNSNEQDGCSTQCTFGPQCGDGFLDEGEECDDGNLLAGDGCDLSCAIEPYCGDFELGAGEECDDGNDKSGDGCSETCTIEPPPPGPYCGDGINDENEQCDDGNTIDGDGCSANCTIETPPPPCQGSSCNPPEPSCGDGTIDAGESCDDGNKTDGDGCSATCTIEMPAPCCGDGIKQDDEECDDGNTIDGDGCSAICTEEPPAPICGDGILGGDEWCDDGNMNDGDGCSATCQLECPSLP